MKPSWTLTLGFAIAVAAGPLSAQSRAIGASLGAFVEDYDRVGDESFQRLPLTLTLGMGAPRSTQLEIELAGGRHRAALVTDATGMSWTRMRLFHLVAIGPRVAIGPDVEVYLKTESSPSLGLGYNRVMPGIQAALALGGEWRTTIRARYEFSGGEDAGVTALSRIVVRPTLFLPHAGRLSSWVRGDIAFDLHGGANQYNVENWLGFRFGPQRRLTLSLQSRLYVGAASRTRNLWRIRTGLTWSLGEISMHHAPHESDLRRATFGESSPSKR
jgi:hypothetical protein